MVNGDPGDPVDFVLLYASQTGNAKAIAEDLLEKSESHDLSGELKCCSDGDPPDTARKFWRRLHKKGQPSDTLNHLSYTVLGLGDTNYTNFCNFGKTIDQKLQSLGGHRFFPCGWADDGTGLEIVIEPWIEGLFPALKNHLVKKRNINITGRKTSCCQGQNTTMDEGDSKICGKDIVDDITRTTSTQDSNNECSNTHNIVSKSSINGSDSQLILNGESTIDQTSIALKNIDNQGEEKRVNETFVTILKYNIDVLSRGEIQCLPLKACAFPLSTKLTLPVQPPPYLTLKYLNNFEASTIESGAPLPSAASKIFQAHIASVRKLTRQDAIKTALEVTLKLPSDVNEFVYEPGDSIGIIVENPKYEVEIVLNLLEITDIADKIYEISVVPNTKKKVAKVPSFIPVKSSLRYILEHCLDIRAVPKKPLMRSLVEYTSNSLEKRRLQELVSKEGAAEYTKHVREMNLTTLDLLITFQSCKPPVTTLLEHLPQLQPRAYSIISSPLVDSENISFVFNVVEIPKKNTVTFARKGICTGWLASLNSELENSPKELNNAFDNLTIKAKADIYANIYLRANQTFHLSKNTKIPIVMVGPGTGVAPFVGFLHHRQKIMTVNPDNAFGESWLFFGCRHKEQDFLYQEELESFHEQGILNHLIVSFSRDDTNCDSPKYVQDNILKHGAVLTPLLVNMGAIIYVCGDAKNMAKDVFEAFVTVLQVTNNQTEVDARKYIAQMQIEKRYLQDVWT
ncbi:Methionine synthase reductase-like [Homarus americanus]|uniref:Methionine synthase reductase n=1 Tax=Homarus americanus TaxID=6706 RepID=A0A8J5N140_HOMAM|nr:Methionine synthase reductase-like [Homarus americanus]